MSSTSRHASAEHERLVAKMDTHAPSAVDATHGGTASPQVSRLLMPDLLHGLERRRRGAGSNGKFVPPVEGAQMAAQRRAKARTAARKMDAALSESLGIGEPIKSGKAVRELSRSSHMRFEYLSRAVPLDLKGAVVREGWDKSPPHRPPWLVKRPPSSSARGFETERLMSTRHRASLDLLPRARPSWQVGPQFEGLFDGDIHPTSLAREDAAPRTARGWLGRAWTGPRISGLHTAGNSRGVAGERGLPCSVPTTAKITELRQQMGKLAPASEASSRVPTQTRLITQQSIELPETTDSGEGDAGQNKALQSSRQRDLRLAPLSRMIPNVFKGRGGIKNRQMLGVPSNVNNPSVSAVREGLRRRFRTAVEAFAFLRSVEEESAVLCPSETDFGWMGPLDSTAIAKGLQMLRIRVDVEQLMLQISSDEQPAPSIPTSLFSVASFSPFSTAVSGIDTNATMADDDLAARRRAVSFDRWNQQMAWHPPLLHPTRALIEARETITEIRATAMRAAAAMNAVKAKTWSVPTCEQELQNTLDFVRDSHELFQVFSAPSSSFDVLEEDGRPKTAPLEELRLQYRDMEALYRQVSILPGCVTATQLQIVYDELEAEEHNGLLARSRQGADLNSTSSSTLPRTLGNGITFKQHQRGVDLISNRLRLPERKTAKTGLELDYLAAFSKDVLLGPYDGTRIQDEKQRLSTDTHAVRAFARIFRAIDDNNLFLRFAGAVHPIDNASSPFHTIAGGGQVVNEIDGMEPAPGEDRISGASSSSSQEIAGSLEGLIDLTNFVKLLRFLSLIATITEKEGTSTVKIVPFRRAKEIFECSARNQAGKLNLREYFRAMELIAAELDAGAAPYLFPCPHDVSGQEGTTYPEYDGSTMLGSMLSLYRDANSLVCALSMTELFVLIELLAYKRIPPGHVVCSQGDQASRSAIILSGSLKQVVSGKQRNGKPTATAEFLHRGSWFAADVPMAGRSTYLGTVTAESEVEMAVLSIEAFDAFCERINSMYARLRTESSAEAVKDRLLARTKIYADLFAQGQNSRNEPDNGEAAGWCNSDDAPLDFEVHSPLHGAVENHLYATSQTPQPRALLHADVKDDDELHGIFAEQLREQRRAIGEEVKGVERPSTAAVSSDYAQQLHELGCHHFALQKVSAARRLLCEACRIRMELFGARDQRTLASVRVLEQVDKWAYRQVSASNKFKVLDREERKPNSLATSQAPHQWQIENDLREFLRSRGAEDRGSSLAANGLHTAAQADNMEVKQCGLEFLKIEDEEGEEKLPRELVQKYSDIQKPRKEWLQHMKNAVDAEERERLRREALRNAGLKSGDQAIWRAAETFDVLTPNQWHFRALSRGSQEVLGQQEVRGMSMGICAILERLTDLVADGMQQRQELEEERDSGEGAVDGADRSRLSGNGPLQEPHERARKAGWGQIDEVNRPTAAAEDKMDEEVESVVQEGTDTSQTDEVEVLAASQPEMSALAQMALIRIEQAKLLMHLDVRQKLRKMMTAINIVDAQAKELRNIAGSSWIDAYAAIPRVNISASVTLQTNIRSLLAKRFMALVRTASLIRQNYRVHRARQLLKRQRTSNHKLWDLVRKNVKGKGSAAEWNDRHSRVRGTMSKAIERFDTFADVDDDSSGAIDFNEFAKLGALKGFKLEELRAMFDDLDTSQDGVLNRDEFAHYLAQNPEHYRRPGTRDTAQLDAKTNEEHTNGANSSADESVDGTQRDAEEHTLQTNGKKLHNEHTAHTDTSSDVTVHATSDAAQYGTGKQTSLHTSSSSEQHLDGVVEADARILPRGPTLMYGEDSDDFDSDNYSSGSDV